MPSNNVYLTIKIISGNKNSFLLLVFISDTEKKDGQLRRQKVSSAQISNGYRSKGDLHRLVRWGQDFI